jgi:hypothetical protein
VWRTGADETDGNQEEAMIEIQVEPRQAAYLMTLMSLALNDDRIGGNLAPVVKEALSRVREEIGRQLEPHGVPVQEVLEEMLPLAEFAGVKQGWGERVVH